MMAGSMAAFLVGAGMMTIALKNKKTKNKAVQLVNNAMDVANNKLSQMK